MVGRFLEYESTQPPISLELLDDTTSTSYPRERSQKLDGNKREKKPRIVKAIENNIKRNRTGQRKGNPRILYVTTQEPLSLCFHHLPSVGLAHPTLARELHHLVSTINKQSGGRKIEITKCFGSDAEVCLSDSPCLAILFIFF